MRMALYCDFVTDGLRPLQLILQANGDSGGFDWSNILYVPLSSPFERFEPEEFGDQLGVSVLLEDLLVPKEHRTASKDTTADRIAPLPSKLGIDLPRIHSRHPEAGITLLVIQIPDAEEVLGYGWRTWLEL